MRIKFKSFKQSKTKCPICDYSINRCQCGFGGSCHPDRSKEREVVLDHMYLFNKKQINHIIELEKFWQISYGDEERTVILNKLEGKSNECSN